MEDRTMLGTAPMVAAAPMAVLHNSNNSSSVPLCSSTRVLYRLSTLEVRLWGAATVAAAVVAGCQVFPRESVFRGDQKGTPHMTVLCQPGEPVI